MARDSDGFVHGGGMHFTCNMAGPDWGEVEAVLCGIKWAISRNLDHVIFEGDCVSVFDRVSKSCEDVTLLGFKIKECVSLLNSGANYIMRWCHRSSNTVANRLSKFSFDNACTLSFNMDSLEIFQTLLIQDSL